MADYPYIRDQQREDREPRYFGVNSTTGLIAGAAAAVGVAIVAPGMTQKTLGAARRVTGEAVSMGRSAVSYIAREYGTQARQAGSFIKAMDYALEGSSPMRMLFGNQDRIEQRFADSYKRSMETINRRYKSPLGGVSTDMEDSLFDLRNMTRGARSAHFKAVQFEAVMRHMERDLPDHLKKGFRTIFTDQRDELFQDPNAARINAILERHSQENIKKTGKAFSMDFKDEQEKNGFINKMLDTLNNYKTRKSPGMSNKGVLRNGGELDTGFNIQGTKQLQQKMFDSWMTEQRGKEDKFLTKMMGNADMQLVRLRDMVKRNENGKWENSLFEADSKRGYRQYDAAGYQKNMGRKIAKYLNTFEKGGLNIDDMLNLPVDSKLFKNRHGQLVDLRHVDRGVYNSLTFLQQNFQVPFLRFNPLDLMHWTTYQTVREAPQIQVFRRGTIQPWLGKNAKTNAHPSAHNQDAAVGPLARDYMYHNGTVSDLVTGEVIKDNMFLTSARFGMIPRAAAGMSNLHRVDYSTRGVMGRLFDLGAQETQSIFSRGRSVLTKFSDEDWERNTFKMMFNGQRAADPEFREKAYKNIYSFVNQFSKPLDDRAAEAINPLVQSAYGKVGIDLTKLNSEEEIMEAFGKLAVGINRRGSGVVRTQGLDNQITHAWNQFQRNPTEFLKNQRIASEHSPFLIGPAEMIDPYETTLVPKLQDIRRMIHQHAIEQVESQNGIGTVGKLITQGVQDGSLSKEAASQYRGMAVLTKMQSYWDDVYRNGESAKQGALGQFFDDVTGSVGDKGFANSLYREIKDHTNVFSAGPGDKPPQYFGLVGHMAMEKGRGYKWALQNYNQQMANGASEIKAGWDSLWGVLGQPFAGRKNMDSVTAATMPFYYFAERLDNAMAKVGLGLSQKNRGSMQSILWNQFGRRVVLPYMAFQQLSYFDDQFNNAPSEGLADMYVKGHLGMASVKETLGLNAIGRYFSDLMPGMDQVGKMPIFAALKHGSFGLIGDNRSPDELEDYYTNGTDPIRKGRWWGIGSNTPWEGGQIDYFAPNWYRRLKSHYKYTDTLYGSENEYWANNWMPTLTHPLAPLRHFITDANHWEEKHRDDRPYPVQGGINELQMIPLVGPTLDNTLGRIVKPRTVRGDLEKQHRAYLTDLNNYIASQYESNTQSGSMMVMPAGGWSLKSGTITGLTDGYVDGEEGLGGWGSFAGIDSVGIGGGSGVGMGDEAIDGTMIGGGAQGQIQNVKGYNRATLAMINLNILNTRKARAISSLDELRDPDVVADLDSVANPYGVQSTRANAFYNLTEMAGIYGFSFRMMSGQTDENPGSALDQSGRMSSYARSYWDLNMGSMDVAFGGEFSEIFRRYLPRDPRKNYYNPIKNTMPDWMPGVDYFVDFQHGDPYVKVAKGEMRLPGAAYEKLNKLHPDQYGEYGAFDRFKILADVAPYSNEYGFWKRQVSFMRANGELSPEEAAEASTIRDQVSARKDKYHYYPYKYKYAKTNMETVHVTHVLDAETFLTQEHPNNPIKLAGVQIPSDAANAQEWLYKQIHEGAALKIRVDADPLFQVRDDTMNTIRAVVYSNGGDDLPFYQTQKGQSINQILVNKDFGDEKRVTKAPDNTAVGTAAFHDQAEITVGKIWENTVHNLGNIPILGVVADKFIQVKSPLELYKKNELYGKSWRPWYEPWSGWIEPMIQTAASKNPLLATAQGVGIGWLFGKAGVGKRWGMVVGGAVMGGAAAMRSLDEAFGRSLPGGDNYAWIPERRQKERDINEYFDILKYVKFKGLYERASLLAKQKEDIDLDKILEHSDARGDKNKKERDALTTMKKWLSIQKKLGYYDEETLQEQIDKARNRLGEIDGDRGQYALGPYAMQAMQYRAEYESTLYGADPNGDMTQIFRALPAKDRQFFTQFMTAAPEERTEILKIIPKNERKFFQAKWGLETDKDPNLSEYFMTHNLPGAGWAGWRPDVSLDSVKLKVVKNEGMEPTEFGMWGDDEKRAEASPVEAVNPFRPSMSLDPFRLEKVLRGAGLHDVNVTLQVAPTRGPNQLKVAMDVMQDRTKDLLTEINANMGSLL